MLTRVNMDTMNDDDAMDMDIDPTLSLNAAGLWSDEESNHDPISDVSDPELVPTIKRKVHPKPLPCSSTMASIPQR
jgi:hypothetical protein